jgi:hypothetical protein
MHALHGVAPAARVHVNRPAPRVDKRALEVVLAGLTGVAVLSALEFGLGRRAKPKPLERAARAIAPDRRGPARRLHASAALLAGSVLADSGVEHYRGAFENPAMFAPLVSSTLAILANVQGALAGGRLRRVRTGAQALAGTVGLIGLGFHLYNITKRPGRLNWLNLFYAAPFGAPGALLLAGLLGHAADELDRPGPARKRLFGLPAGRALAAVTSFGLFGTVAEVLLLHFRGAFQNPFMWLPITLPPGAAVCMATAAAAPGRGRRWLSRAWLWATTLIGFVGVGFHAFGISRAMGGWRNWSQNVLDGPPLPAPPSFSALALAGIAALDLIEAGEGGGRRR